MKIICFSCKIPYTSLAILAMLFLSFSSNCQDTTKTVPDGTEGQYLKVRTDTVSKKEMPPNEFNGSYTTLKIGFGYIAEYATYSYDKTFRKQMDSAGGLSFGPKVETRDFRILASGIIKTKKRPFSWKFAFMYDGDDKVWMMRETGLTIGVPELFGNIFIGRTKEGYSMIKVMNAHSVWMPERQIALDVIPILADGIKWMGFLPKPRVFWNLGYYNDFLSKNQSFSTYKWQIDARIGWLPYYNKEKNHVLHIAANLRYGKPLDGKITLKSRPESNPAPQVINTGSFKSDYSDHLGGEIFYSNGKLLIGSEVMLHNFQSKEGEDHQFFGGEAFVSFLFTKGRRPYYTAQSLFGFVNVAKPVFKGGLGDWELVLRYTNFNLDDGSIKGGKFWRFTPLVNWYMSKNVRLEFIYGYGKLNRYQMEGILNVYQIRLQLSVL
jgi:phosphate-selective porin OprO/OprP